MVLTPDDVCQESIVLKNVSEIDNGCGGEEGRTETTDAKGEAVFGGVRPGRYTVDEVLQDGWTQTVKYCDSNRGDYKISVLDAVLSDSFWVNPGSKVNCFIGNYTPTIVTDVESVCVDNFPYLRWSVRANGFVPSQFKFEWFTVAGNDAGTPAGTLVETQTFTPASTNVVYDSTTDTYSATTLWPGADDNPLDQDWPGWKLENGLWVKDPSDFGGNLRANAEVTLSVNPTQQADVAYPSTNGSCNPSNPAVLGATTTLPKTGSAQKFATVVGLSLIVFALITSLNSKKFRKDQ